MTEEVVSTPSVGDQVEQDSSRLRDDKSSYAPEPSVQHSVDSLYEDARSLEDGVELATARQDQHQDKYAGSLDRKNSVNTGHSCQVTPIRTSLEMLQQWPSSRTWPAANSEAALQSPLPPSLASFIITTISAAPVSESTINSLDQLAFLRPEDIALPEIETRQGTPDSSELPGTKLSSHPSGAEATSKKKKPRKPVKAQAPPAPPPPPPPPAPAPDKTEVDHYGDYVNQLATSLPNFSNVAATTGVRHHWSWRIVLHDRIRRGSSEFTERIEPWAQGSTLPSYEETNQTLKQVVDDCVQRVIIVEDLAPRLIQYLGATFQIPAHVFEEHLKDSGYQSIRDSWAGATTWDTQSSAQGFFSMTWYRAVMPTIPVTTRVRTKLITDRRVSVRCVDSDCNKQHNVFVRTAGNIWRHNLDLCAEPGVYHKGSLTEFPVGWEERATIWSRKIKNCHFVIMLLDPLPILHIEQDANAPARQQAPNNLPLMAAFLPQRKVDELKARRTKPVIDLVPDWADQVPSFASVKHPEPGLPPIRPHPEDAAGTSSSSHNSFSSSHGSGPIVTDTGSKSQKATGVNVQSTGIEAAPAAPRRRGAKYQGDSESITDSKVVKGQAQSPTTSMRTDHGGSAPPSETSSPSRAPTSLLSQGSETHGPFVPYYPIKDRSSSAARINDKFTARQVRRYARSLQVPTSTLDEFDYFLQLPTKGKETTHDPFRPLFRVIHDDTQSLAGIIRVTSQRIREDTMDEDLMQKRVMDWRRLLHRLNVSLADIDQRLRSFSTFSRDFEEQSLAFHQGKEMPSEKFASDTREVVRDCINLLDRSANSLLAEMQIVDSRRSIAEAKSVAKLTELAFIFIPLSFVASLFSMQVDVLESPVPLYHFILVAVALVAVVYAIRLSIRSSRILEYKQTTLLRIQDDSHLQYNQPIPTRKVIAWVGKAMGETAWTSTKSAIVIVAPVVVVAAVFAAILSPIILLWLRGINKGFAAAITILMLLLDVALLYPVATTASGKLKIDPKQIVRDIKGNLELKKAEKKRAKKRELKLQGIVDPEAQGMESSDDEDEFEMAGALKSTSDVV